VFLEVGSIINQHSLEGEMSGQLGLFAPVWKYEQNYRGMVKGYDRPTITYTPLTGEKFAANLLSPIPPVAIVSMSQSGWPVDFVLRLTCDSINGVRNSWHTGLSSREADPEFAELLQQLRKIQTSGAIALRLERRGKETVALLMFAKEASPPVARAMARVREILRIPAGTHELVLTYGAIAKGPRELALLSRSMFQLMVRLALCVEVPVAHQREGRAVAVPEGAVGDAAMRIRSSEYSPKDAAAAVRYKGHWFYVDDRDIPSKRMLSLLMLLSSFAETGGGAGSPVITVQAG
jgi:hypothetical protein